MEFAVVVTGRSDIPEKNDKGEPLAWLVLAVDTDNQMFLLALDDQSFRWVKTEDCKLHWVYPETSPRPVYFTQPQPVVAVKQPEILLPHDRN